MIEVVLVVVVVVAVAVVVVVVVVNDEMVLVVVVVLVLVVVLVVEVTGVWVRRYEGWETQLGLLNDWEDTKEDSWEDNGSMEEVDNCG